MSDRPRMLDLFCKEGGMSMGYWRAGWDVIGVDRDRQKRYPFAFWQGDAMEIMHDVAELRKFDGIHASPPCQAWSVANSIHGRTDHPQLIAETRDLLMASGVPFVIENVPRAPVRGDIVLCGTMFGLGTAGLQLRRHRKFECGRWSPPALGPAACNHDGLTVSVFGHDTLGACKDKRSKHYRHPNERESLGVGAGRDAMGIDWMSREGLSEAIPPHYGEFVGRHMRRAIGK